MRAAAAVVAVGTAATASALTNDLATIQATTSDINAGMDTGTTIGLGLLGVGFIIGALKFGLGAAFKKRPS